MQIAVHNVLAADDLMVKVVAVAKRTYVAAVKLLAPDDAVVVEEDVHVVAFVNSPEAYLKGMDQMVKEASLAIQMTTMAD